VKKIKLIFLLMLICGFALVLFRNDRRVSEKLNIEVTSPTLPLFAITPSPAVTPSPDWQEVGVGMELRTLEYTYNSSKYHFQVEKIDPTQTNIHLSYFQEGKTLRSWAEEVNNGLVVNAGFFKENNEPVGLLFTDAIRRDQHRIKPEGTGLLSMHAGEIKILDLSAVDVPEPGNLTDALQSYPMLISNGQIVVGETLTSQDRRTAIGMDTSGNVYIFTAEYPHLGLYEFATILKESPLQLSEVLNLDGGGSTGLVIKTPKHSQVIDSLTTVPTVLIVEKKL
jgi:uncharacterized protein YigE (DUF2233 family)